MIAGKVDVDVSDAMKDVTIVVRLHGVNRVLRRIKVALLFFKIGAWLGGFGIEVKS